MKDSYLGPRDGKGDEEHVSRDYCGGIVFGCARYPEFPIPTAYSREVAGRIARPSWSPPVQQLVDVLRWRSA